MSDSLPEPVRGLLFDADGEIVDGVHYGLANEAYHSGPGVSKSGLDLIARSPMHYHHARTHPESRKRSASQAACTATELGTVFHTLVLEPHKLTDVCVLGLGIERRSKADKETWEEFERRHNGKLVMRRDELQLVGSMADAVRAHPVASVLLDPEAPGAAEASAYWRDEATGVLCRCRPDRTRPDLRVLVDLKSTLDADVSANFSSFERGAAQHRYHVSDAMSTHGWAQATGEAAYAYIFVVVEKDPPHGVAVYQYDDEAREVGRELMARDLDTYARCLEADEWPGYPPQIRPLSLPRWAVTV